MAGTRGQDPLQVMARRLHLTPPPGLTVPKHLGLWPRAQEAGSQQHLASAASTTSATSAASASLSCLRHLTCLRPVPLVCSREVFWKLEAASHSPGLAVCPQAGCHPL